MDISPPYDVLDDDTFAPLKRNHACLQRKVKCDGVRPTCNPCLRTHAHALRTAARNKTPAGPCVCSYAEADGDGSVTPPDGADISLGAASDAAPAPRARVAGDKKARGTERNLVREKELRQEEERDTLRARIAELEAKLASLQTPSSASSSPSDTVPRNVASMNASVSTWPAASSLNQPAWSSGSNWVTSGPAPPFDKDPFLLDLEGLTRGTSAGGPGAQITASYEDTGFDFTSFSLLPAHWPRNLPPPMMLEHLVETFFNCVPQIPRIIHRANLMSRLRHPPSSKHFPFPALLHAICAAAAPHTAAVHTVMPGKLNEMRERHVALGLDLELFEDFQTAQTEAAERVIRHSVMQCDVGPGLELFDMLRAHLILCEVNMGMSLPLRSWLVGGVPNRLIKTLGLENRNKVKTEKPALMPDVACDGDREERIASVWTAYMQDVTLSLNVAFSMTMDTVTVKVPLPTFEDQFRRDYGCHGNMQSNPQNADSPDLLYRHPIQDPYVLAIKASILVGRVSAWIQHWHQRVKTPGDELDGLQTSSFISLNNTIFTFQLGLPSAIKNVYKMLDAGAAHVFDPNMMTIHVLPHVGLMLLHEMFVDWQGPDNASLNQIQRAYEAVINFVHLIPVQVDLTQILTPTLCMSFYSVGRVIAKFATRAILQQDFDASLRYRTDLSTVQNLLTRYGAKHAFGLHMTGYLDHYYDVVLEAAAGNREPVPTVDCRAVTRAIQASIAASSTSVTPPSDYSGSQASQQAPAAPRGSTSGSSIATPPGIPGAMPAAAGSGVGSYTAPAAFSAAGSNAFPDYNPAAPFDASFFANLGLEQLGQLGGDILASTTSLDALLGLGVGTPGAGTGLDDFDVAAFGGVGRPKQS